MKKKLYILSIAAMTVVSCNFLGTYPEDVKVVDDYYNNQQECERALNGVYCTLASTNLYGGNMLGRLGLCADLGYESYSTDEGTVGYYDVVPSDVKVTGYWRYFYQGIGNANRFLENIDKSDKIDSSFKKKAIAEVRFLRAYFYFMLAVRFGDVPLVTSVPASVKQEDLQVERTAQSEVYDFVLSEMLSVAEDLPDASTLQGGGHLSKSAAYGIMARVCLNAAGYPCYKTELFAKAKEYGKKVIDYDFHKLNPSYQQVFINYMQDLYDIKESIWEVEFYGNNTGTYTTTAGMVGRNNGIGFSNSGGVADEIGVSIGTVRATPYFYQLFGEGDLRRDWTIADYTYNSTTGEKTVQTTNYWIRYCGKFRREYEILLPKSVSYSPTNFPLLRYSDVLLMYAEAVACDDNSSSDEVTDAYECLNQVRRRGYGLDVTVPDASVDIEDEGKITLLETVKDERARELGHEFLRKDDIVRWGEFYQRMKYIEMSIPGAYTSSYYVAARQYYGNAQSRDWLWPVPSYELGVNRKLTQNLGW